jgi:K+ transporter
MANAAASVTFLRVGLLILRKWLAVSPAQASGVVIGDDTSRCQRVFLVGALGVVYGDIGAIPGWGALPHSRAKAVGFNGRQYLRPLGAVALSMRWLLN